MGHVVNIIIYAKPGVPSQARFEPVPLFIRFKNLVLPPISLECLIDEKLSSVRRAVISMDYHDGNSVLLPSLGS